MINDDRLIIWYFNLIKVARDNFTDCHNISLTYTVCAIDYFVYLSSDLTTTFCHAYVSKLCSFQWSFC